MPGTSPTSGYQLLPYVRLDRKGVLFVSASALLGLTLADVTDRPLSTVIDVVAFVFVGFCIQTFLRVFAGVLTLWSWHHKPKGAEITPSEETMFNVLVTAADAEVFFVCAAWLLFSPTL